MVRGCWAARRDGKHWSSLVPTCETHKLVRVYAGPGEEIPGGITVPADKVWLSYGYFPYEEPANDWRRATDAEVAKQEADEEAGPFVFTSEKATGSSVEASVSSLAIAACAVAKAELQVAMGNACDGLKDKTLDEQIGILERRCDAFAECHGPRLEWAATLIALLGLKSERKKRERETR
jgi:hypothetical protein